jgi:hypothetical protein
MAEEALAVEETAESTETSGEAFAAPDEASAEAQAEKIENDAFSVKDDAEASDAESETGSEQGGEQDAPESYEVSLPEGWSFSDDDVAIMKEQGMNNDQAQALADRYIAKVEQMQKDQAARWQEQASIWTQASKAAGLLTGESMGQAKAGLVAVDHDGSLGQTLHHLGLDHHPGIIEAFRSHGAAVSPPTEIPSSATDGPSRLETAAERMFPTMSNKE